MQESFLWIETRDLNETIRLFEEDQTFSVFGKCIMNLQTPPSVD